LDRATQAARKLLDYGSRSPHSVSPKRRRLARRPDCRRPQRAEHLGLGAEVERPRTPAARRSIPRRSRPGLGRRGDRKRGRCRWRGARGHPHCPHPQNRTPIVPGSNYAVQFDGFAYFVENPLPRLNSPSVICGGCTRRRSGHERARALAHVPRHLAAFPRKEEFVVAGVAVPLLRGPLDRR
jgi:hypothetical protein